jgi:hypothetical protein
METTNAVFNLTLYDSITVWIVFLSLPFSRLFVITIQPSSLMCWIRTIVSNRMANSGAEWVQIMQRYNSGTYNNQVL